MSRVDYLHASTRDTHVFKLGKPEAPQEITSLSPRSRHALAQEVVGYPTPKYPACLRVCTRDFRLARAAEVLVGMHARRLNVLQAVRTAWLPHMAPRGVRAMASHRTA